MLRFILTRFGMAVPTLLIVALTVFLLVRLIPGDPASLMLGDMASASSLAALRSQLGLDQPVPVQFVIWLSRIVGAILDIRSPRANLSSA